jgi:hypothetical protein
VKPIAACAVAVMMLGLPAAARAQGGGAGRAHSLELAASVLWFSSSSLGARDANLTSNDAAGSPYPYFTASAEARRTAAFEVRASYNVTGLVAVEGGLTYRRPEIDFTIARDAEGAAGFTAPGETTSEFVVDASVVAYLSRSGFARGRGRPFVEAGAGYLRELHGQASATAGYAALDTGQVYHVGGGVKYFFRSRRTGLVKAYGLRVAGRYSRRSGGFTFDGRRPGTVAAGAGLVVAF